MFERPEQMDTPEQDARVGRLATHHQNKLTGRIDIIWKFSGGKEVLRIYNEALQQGCSGDITEFTLHPSPPAIS